MINPSSAPTSPNAMPAGLGALTQMGPTPKGKSPSNMGQVMAMARKMSDMQLSDVLKGLSLAVPQFAAMTEAMGRKSLRNAMQGAEAQMQAKAPNLKDKMLAEEDVMPAMVAQPVMAAGGGLTSIPAPNMNSMDMASGGIIAFDDGGEVPRFNGAAQSLINVPSSSEFDQDVAISRFDSPAVAKEKRERALRREQSIKEQQLLNAQQAKIQGGNSKNIAEPVSVNPDDPFSMAANAPRPLVGEPPAPNAAAPNASPRPSAGGGGGGGGSPVVDPFASLNFDTSKYDEKYKALFGADPTFTKRDSPYYGMKYEGEDAGKVKEQGIGFGLMKAGQALLKNPTFAGGLGDAIGAFGDQGWLTAKEIKAAKKDERDYNFNMAKATELFEQGESERAIKIQTLAQAKQAKVAELGLSALKNEIEGLTAKDAAKFRQDSLALQKMQLNQQTPEIRNALFASQNPNVAPFMSSVARAQGTYTIDKAVDDFNTLQKNAAENPTLAKELKKLGINSPQEYQRYILQQGTIGGNGGVGDAIRNQALAIRKERGLS
jgi:hypothetical protein